MQLTNQRSYKNVSVLGSYKAECLAFSCLSFLYLFLSLSLASFCLIKSCKNFCSLFSFFCCTRTCIIPLENRVNISDYAGRSDVFYNFTWLSFLFFFFLANFSCLERQCQVEWGGGKRGRLCVFCISKNMLEGEGGERAVRRDLASSSGRVAAFNEVQMSLSWQAEGGGGA